MEKLSSKSLMVGDWVQGNPCGQHCDRNNNTYYKIAVLDIGNHCWGYSVCGAIVELKYDDIFPIPLTPEILEKNGFKVREDTDDTEFYYYDCYEINVSFDEGISEENIPPIIFLTIEFAEKSIAMPIEFVHELQQAMRIMGCDKEIEL